VTPNPNPQDESIKDEMKRRGITIRLLFLGFVHELNYLSEQVE